MENIRTEQTGDKRMPASRKYHRNFVDVLIIIIVALAVLSFFFRGQAEKFVNRVLADDTVMISIAIEGLDPTIAEQFGSERELYVEDGKFGTVQTYEITSGTKTILSSSPFEYLNVTDTYTRDVTATVLVDGIQKDSGFYLDTGEKVAVGKTFTVFAKGQKFTIIVTKIG